MMEPAPSALRSRQALRSGGGLVLAVLWLHALGAFRFPWEAVPFHVSWLRGSLDVAALALLGGLVSLRWGRSRVPGHVLAVLVLILPLFRFASTVMPSFYGKKLDIYNDIDLASGVFYLLLNHHAPLFQLGLVIAMVSVSVGVYCATYLAWRRVLLLVAGGSGRGRLGWLGAIGLFLVLGGIDTGRDGNSGFSTPFLVGDIVDAAAAIPRSRDESSGFEGKIEEARRRLEGVPTDLGRLAGVDVYLLFIESYGRCLFVDEKRRAQLEGWSASWLELLEANGYRMRTAFAYPSIRGGNSTLAHAELLTGAPTRTRRMFDRLLSSDLPALPVFFRRAGYRAINVQPAMPRAWERGDFFGFNVDVFGPQLHYEGHIYQWGSMPDQYALAYLLEEYLKPSEEPLFVQYVSVTSHAPFSKIPPYVPDWQVAATSEAFDGPPAQDFGIRWLNYAGHPGRVDAYVESIRYSLDTAFRFVTELDRDSLVIVLGDHQPPLGGNLKGVEASFDVPVHVIGKDPRLVARFAPLGFEKGFFPAPGTRSHPFYEFMSTFLGMFSLGNSDSGDPADGER